MKPTLSTPCVSLNKSHDSFKSEVKQETISQFRKEKRSTTQLERPKRISLYLTDEPLLSPVRQRPPQSSSQRNLASQSFFFEELSSLQQQIHEINSKISQNIQILKEKEEKTKELTTILHRIEQKTLTTDISFDEESTNSSICKQCLIS